ncbi:MAG: NADH-quinone oxidoreductase subunit L [Pseudomonadota bacterium]|jgi:proton-translocating NADH-quinone oxidoreductase, chain L|nr:MAG: NADH-quinone oxidoreductase subunit L [Pseudomonadota bacterium]
MNPNLLLAIVLLPLAGAIIAGLGGRLVSRMAAAYVTIAGVAISCVLSLIVLKQIYWDGVPAFNGPVYTWLVSDGVTMQVGFLVDRLTALMMAVVTFVSLCVHVYTIGYMHDDPGFKRFFSYISLFTFSMLMLVMSNNFMQLFFGWEAVGVVSYLLIGFWYTRPSAIFANLKAFLVNRVGDFGFVLGIAGVLYYTGSLDYTAAFEAAPRIAQESFPLTSTTSVEALGLICILLFIGAMGKSAQVPLHVWLPDSMEGPTPISALIHAATMVTAGIFMVARMSPLFEHSELALNFVLIIGATTALFMGLLGIVNNDIKRVVAYSTLSQLGYMTVALGVSAYGAAIFHLMTHAFFKALLFLAAGSVIIGMHHEQDMRKMGGLAKYMPVTAVTCWIGALALIGTPFFSGFYSKDMIIEAAAASHRWAAPYAYWCVLIGVFVTALYTFRMLFLTFHGEERFRTAHAHAASHGGEGGHGESHGSADAHHHGGEPHESPPVVTVPLIALAIPSIFIGLFTVGPVLFGGYFGDSIFVLERNDVLAELGHEFHGPVAFALHGFITPTFWLALAGVVTAWVFFLWKPGLADRAAEALRPIRTILVNKYYFDWFNENVIARGSRLLGRALWRGGDQVLIDGALVNGTAATVGRFGGVVRLIQSGYLYSYAFWMFIGLAVLLGWFLLRS